MALLSVSGNDSVGVLAVHPGVTAVIDSLIIRNGKSSAGAGIMNGGTLTIVDSLLLGNHTEFDPTVSGQGDGGAIYNGAEADLTIANSGFAENTGARGGGIYCRGTMTVLNSMFLSNAAVSDNGDGGAIFENCDLTIANSTFSSNVASHNGGALLTDNDLNPVVIINSTFYSNTATNVAGGIANYGGLVIVNSTFSQNGSTSGGAIRNGLGAVLSLRNSILANSVGTVDCIKGDSVPAVENINNLIESTGSGFESCGAAFLTGDPVLGALQANGGLTDTMALGAGSPAINAGKDTECPLYDQRGVPRPQDIHCDLGAYEVQGPIEVSIGGAVLNTYSLAASESRRVSYAGVNSGPLKISATDNTSIMAAARVVYRVDGANTSFTEMMALPNSQLDTIYWLPWYNNVDLDTQLRFANVSNSPATVTVTIGGQPMGTPIPLAAGASTRVSFPGVNNGPVKIVSTQNIVAAERLIYKANGKKTSFSEMVAVPNKALNSTYWLPWYNNKDLDTQLRIANVSNQTASVHVYIGGAEMQGSPLPLAAGESTRKSFPGINSGPVKIVSDQDIVAAERLIYKVNGVNTSFSEMMALPNSQLDTTYWLPWYNNKDLDTQLRFANVHDTDTATVYVYIGGAEMTGSPFTLLPGESTRKSFTGVNAGPVQIVSNVNIVAAERLIHKVNNIATSFSEMMALPESQLDTTYWLPWYNNLDLDTQLRFGVP
jgi:predicted outer membrane repeat protein